MIFWITTILAVIGFIIGVIAFLFPNLGQSIILWLLCGPRFNWEAIPKEIARAQDKVYILQTWLPQFHSELPFLRKALEHKNMEFRVLLLDQKLVQFRLRLREPTSNLLPANVNDLKLLAKEYNAIGKSSRIQVKFYYCLPFGPIYIIDEDIYWGLYFANDDSMKGPVYHCKTHSILGKMILSSYEEIWKSAAYKTGNLSVTPANSDISLSHATEETEIEQIKTRFRNQVHFISQKEYIKKNADVGCLCILRHVDTDFNTAGIITGGLDIGINADGRKRAIVVSKEFPMQNWDHIYSSPLRRCIESLDILLAKKYKREVEIRAELIERDMGDVQGYFKDQYALSLPQYKGHDIIGSFHTKANDGERYCDVFRRVLPFLEEIVKKVHDGKKILVCSHESPIRIMLMVLLEQTIKDTMCQEIKNGEFFYFTEPDQ